MAERWLGLAPGHAPRPEPPKHPKPHIEPDRIERARAIWKAAIPANGTVVERYLRHRCITILPASIRYIEAFRHWPTKGNAPAMVLPYGAPRRFCRVPCDRAQAGWGRPSR